MCEFSGKLVALLDHELGEREAAEVRQHLQRCAECHQLLARLDETSRTFAAYCDVLAAAQPRRVPALPRWVPALAAATAAALLATFFFVPRAHKQPTPASPPALAQTASSFASSRVVASITPSVAAPRRRARRKPVAVRQPDVWAPEPVVQISIPADAMFAPGAIPQGINFFADVTLRRDGSARGLRLQPQPASLERR